MKLHLFVPVSHYETLCYASKLPIKSDKLIILFQQNCMDEVSVIFFSSLHSLSLSTHFRIIFAYSKYECWMGCCAYLNPITFIKMCRYMFGKVCVN